MAEVIRENIQDNSCASDDQENPIFVLLFATKWQFETYGLSTVNKSLVNNLRIVDPEGNKIKITCGVVEEEGNIKDGQREDAEKYKVKLRGGKQPRDPKEKPNINWLDRNIGTYYPHLMKETNYVFIIGHVPFLANGPLNLRDLHPEGKSKPKVILMIHDFPRTSDGDINEDTLLEWLREADVVFSVGKEVESEVFSSIVSLPSEQQPIHKMYIPAFQLELFNVHRDTVQGNKVRGMQNVTLMTGEQKNLEINGLNFALAVASTFRASKHILEFDGVKTNLILITENMEDKDQWKKEFEEILKIEETEERAPYFQPCSPENFDKFKVYMRKSNVMILPLKSSSPLFGSEALSAIASGVPILVSNHSGIASLLKTMYQGESIIRESNKDSDVNIWKDHILQKLLRPDDSQQRACRLREQLLLESSIAQSHLDFIRTIVGKILHCCSQVEY